MKPTPLKALHLPKYPARQGGMDALLRLHQEQGESVLGLLKHENQPTIGFNTVLPFHWQKKSLNQLAAVSAAHDVSLYYNCWGADIFSKYDHAAKRIGYLHNHFPDFENYIKHFASGLDGFLTVNPATTKSLRKLLQRTHPAENIQTIPLPISPPPHLPTIRKETIIGLIGRINFTQKRYDRLPEFAQILAQRHPHCRIEVLGDGPDKKPLVHACRNLSNLKFIPWQTDETYWKTLYRWQYILFLSDYEGLPISLLEALHAGCTAIYPDLHQGDPQGLPLQLYPTGNMLRAVDRVSAEVTSNPTHPEGVGHGISLKHNLENYLPAMQQALSSIQKISIGKIDGRSHSCTSKSYNRSYARFTHKAHNLD